MSDSLLNYGVVCSVLFGDSVCAPAELICPNVVRCYTPIGSNLVGLVTITILMDVSSYLVVLSCVSFSYDRVCG